MSFEGRYLRVVVVPSESVGRDERISRPGTLFDWPGGTLRVDRAHSSVPHWTEDGRYIRNFIHLEQDLAKPGFE